MPIMRIPSPSPLGCCQKWGQSGLLTITKRYWNHCHHSVNGDHVGSQNSCHCLVVTRRSSSLSVTRGWMRNLDVCLHLAVMRQHTPLFLPECYKKQQQQLLKLKVYVRSRTSEHNTEMFKLKFKDHSLYQELEKSQTEWKMRSIRNDRHV